MKERKDIRILIACEESQTECLAFRRLGYTAFSCDVQPCSGGHPEWHIQADVRTILGDNWDLMVAHPPCTYLTKAGARFMFPRKELDCKRFVKGVRGALFFYELLYAPIKYIAVENPTPLNLFNLPMCDCVVQPYEFGECWSKRTCLWLKNLPPLIPTCFTPTYKSYVFCTRGGKKRSKSFAGISAAMARQWGAFIEHELAKS